MSKQLIYSILQYKHSPVLEEALNVGVLFYFPDETKKIQFFFTEPTRIKPIYKDFDSKYFHTVLKIVQTNIEKFSDDIYATSLLNSSLKEFITLYLLKEDDTSLQFTNIHSAINVFSSTDKAIEAYIHLLLPLSEKKDSEVLKHDEKFIIKKVKTRILSRRPELEAKLLKDVQIDTEIGSLKFDFAWQNGSLNLVKPISFDLHEIHTFQSKTAEYCSYLNWLNSYTKQNNCRVDILLAEPQDRSFKDIYYKSVKLLESIDSNKQLVPFDEIDNYADSAASYLLQDSPSI